MLAAGNSRPTFRLGDAVEVRVADYMAYTHDRSRNRWVLEMRLATSFRSGGKQAKAKGAKKKKDRSQRKKKA